MIDAKKIVSERLEEVPIKKRTQRKEGASGGERPGKGSHRGTHTHH